MTEAQASARLGELGLTPAVEVVVRHRKKQYDGLVISQMPAAHTSVPAGSTVVIRVESYVAPVGPTGPTGPSGITGTT
jgi:beta-lactam-binding protein with PASTA domain